MGRRKFEIIAAHRELFCSDAASHFSNDSRLASAITWFRFFCLMRMGVSLLSFKFVFQPGRDRSILQDSNAMKGPSIRARNLSVGNFGER